MVTIQNRSFILRASSVMPPGWMAEAVPVTSNASNADAISAVNSRKRRGSGTRPIAPPPARFTLACFVPRTLSRMQFVGVCESRRKPIWLYARRFMVSTRAPPRGVRSALPAGAHRAAEPRGKTKVVSGPVSRILCPGWVGPERRPSLWAPHRCGARAAYPGVRTGRAPSSPIRPCSGRGLHGCPVSGTPVRSYRTISPLPAALRAVCFCCTFRRLAPPRRYLAPVPGGVRTFLTGAHAPRCGRPAR